MMAKKAIWSSVLLVLLLLVTLLGHSTSIKSLDITVEPNQDLELLRRTNQASLLEVADQLINGSEELETGLRWKKDLSQPGNITDSQYYTGNHFGVVGIGSFFLELYNATGNESYFTIAKEAGNYLASRKQMYQDQIIWTRAEDTGSVYTSQKYGIAGIVSYLLNLYTLTQEGSYLNLAELGLRSLLSKQLNVTGGTAWGYSYYGTTPIVDSTYGNSGIADAFIKAYKVTGNQTYLDTAVRAMQWVASMTNITNNTLAGERSILYSTSSMYQNYFTGYGTGAAGVAEAFLSLYSATSEYKWLVYAQQIANWLESTGESGLWMSGGVDLLTGGENGEGTYIGLAAGSTGVGMFFLNLFEVTHDLRYLNVVQKVVGMLGTTRVEEGNKTFWPVQLEGTFEGHFRADLGFGQAGVGMFLAKHYGMFGRNTTISWLRGINSYLDSKIMHDSSLYEGLAGLGLYYLSVGSALTSEHTHGAIDLENLPPYDFSQDGSELLTGLTEPTIRPTITASNNPTSAINGSPFVFFFALSSTVIYRRRKED